MGGIVAGWRGSELGSRQRYPKQHRSVAKQVSSTQLDVLPIFASWQDGLLVQNNIASGGWDSGIYVSNSSKNYIIRGNTVFNVGGNGIHNNGDASQGGPGINTNALIENNIIHDVGFISGGQAISCDGLQNSTIRNNLIYNAYGKGISLFVVTAAAGCQNDIVVNNTVVTGAPGQSYGGAALRIVDDSAGNTVLNNILYSYNSSSGSIDMNSGDSAGMTSDYNIVTNLFYSDGSHASLSNWQGGYAGALWISTPSSPRLLSSSSIRRGTTITSCPRVPQSMLGSRPTRRLRISTATHDPVGRDMILGPMNISQGRRPSRLSARRPLRQCDQCHTCHNGDRGLQ